MAATACDTVAVACNAEWEVAEERRKNQPSRMMTCLGSGMKKKGEKSTEWDADLPCQWCSSFSSCSVVVVIVIAVVAVVVAAVVVVVGCIWHKTHLSMRKISQKRNFTRQCRHG